MEVKIIDKTYGLGKHDLGDAYDALVAYAKENKLKIKIILRDE